GLSSIQKCKWCITTFNISSMTFVDPDIKEIFGIWVGNQKNLDEDISEGRPRHNQVECQDRKNGVLFMIMRI
ncbi:MAG: hypothetical protein ACJA1A_003260, partial [Saprospiraceae bacterium]